MQAGTLSYSRWMQPPVQLYIRFYLFNVTNSQDVIDHHAKPTLQELGPYTFR